MTSAIKMKNISKSYGTIKALDNLSLEVEKGNIFGFLGPNGAGKTTAIKILMNLIKPDQGQGEILGYDINENSVSINQKIGYVPEADQLYDYMKVKEIIKFNQEFYNNWDNSLVNKYNDFFKLPLDKKIKDLSMGMKKQLSLVLAMASQPELLILDEPTSGLDPINRQEILRIILEEIAVESKTVFFSTHLLGDVERIADSVAIIKNGKLIEKRMVDDLKSNVKKIRVVFQKEPDKEIFSLQGIKDYSRDGKAYIFSVNKNLTEILNKLKEQPHFVLEVIDQNLEEIFIEKAGENNYEI